MRKSQWIFAGLLAAAAAIVLMLKPWGQTDPSFDGSFSLANGAGAPVTDMDYRGKYLAVYFGYTFCPDVCPTALGELATALDRLPQAKLDKLEAVFISVDPDRDHGENLTKYAEAFHPKIRGLTGTRQQIDAAARAYGARYEFVGDRASGDYSIDHTSVIYVMGPDGKLLTRFTHNASPATMFAKLDSAIE